MPKPLIVGIDIGTTTGLAIYDLDKNLLYTGSKKYFSISNVIKEIMSFGNPLIIATDRKKVSSKIKKIAASFNCKTFHPDHDLTIQEKENIIRIPIKDAHEKDALASASFAFRGYETMFNNINRALTSLSLEQYRDDVKEMIITREAKNIAEAIEKVRPKEVVKVKTKIKEIYLNWRDKAKEYKRKSKGNERRYEILKLYSEKLEEKLKALERQKQTYIEEEKNKNEKVRKEILKEKELRKREILIKQLQFELSKQKNLREIYEEKLKKQQELIDIHNEGLIPVIKIPDFKKESIANVNREFDIRNKVVWIENFEPSKMATRALLNSKPKIVISEMEEETKEFLKRYGIIVVNSLKPQIRNYYAAVSPEKIETTIKRTERKDFLNWLEDYRGR